MPSRKNRTTNTPSNGKKGSATGKKGIERTAAAPEIVSPPAQGGNLPPMKFSNKKWFIYDQISGDYKQRDENTVSHLVQQELGRVSSYQIRDNVAQIRYAVDYLGRFHPAIRYDQDDILINVLNGLTRVKSDGSHDLEKHNPKWCFGGVLPVSYDPNATCPTFEQELQDKLPEALDQKVLLFFGAYCLLPDCRYGVTLFNYGPSHTGKSTLIVHGFGAVFGDLTGCLKLSEICPENFSGLSHVPTLTSKLLNIGAEVDSREVKDTTNFKRLISGETVRAREAYERGGEVQTYCKLTFNMNELPKINGTMAEVERIRLIHFNRITDHEKRDYRVEQKIKLEGSGIFMLLLRQMSELLKLDVFPYGSVNSQDIFLQLQDKIDPYGHFIKAYKGELELGAGVEFEMESGELDPYIIEFIRDNNYEAIFYPSTFKRRLYARFNIKSGEPQWRPRGVPRNQQKKVSVLHGIRLRPKPKN